MKVKRYCLLIFSICLNVYGLLIPRPIFNDIYRLNFNYFRENYGNYGFSQCFGLSLAVLRGNQPPKKQLLTVTDEGDDNIVYGLIEYKENGERELLWSKSFGSNGNGNGQFDDPQGVCIDTTNYGNSNIYYIYVADCSNNRIVKLQYNSSTDTISWVENIVTSPVDSFSSPTDVACMRVEPDTATWVVIADAGNNRIVYFKDVNGQRTWFSYGTSGSGDGQFNNPTSVDIQEIPPRVYSIYVTDTDNQRLVRVFFSPSSPSTVTWAQSANIPDFSAVATTPYYGDVYALDPFAGKVYHYGFGLSPLLETYGSSGCGNGQFMWPKEISICDGECGITEEWSNVTGVQYFWLDTEVKDSYPYPDSFDLSSLWSGETGVCINYTLTGGAKACTVKVYDGTWNLKKKIIRTQQLAGTNFAIWDGTDDSLNLVPPATYHIIL